MPTFFDSALNYVPSDVSRSGFCKEFDALKNYMFKIEDYKTKLALGDTEINYDLPTPEAIAAFDKECTSALQGQWPSSWTHAAEDHLLVAAMYIGVKADFPETGNAFKSRHPQSVFGKIKWDVMRMFESLFYHSGIEGVQKSFVSEKMDNFLREGLISFVSVYLGKDNEFDQTIKDFYTKIGEEYPFTNTLPGIGLYLSPKFIDIFKLHNNKEISCADVFAKVTETYKELPPRFSIISNIEKLETPEFTTP